MALAKLADPTSVDIKAGRLKLAGKRHREGEPHIAETNDDNSAPELHTPTYNRLIRFGYACSEMDAITYKPALQGRPRPMP
jgi:hypothetical protein